MQKIYRFFGHFVGNCLGYCVGRYLYLFNTKSKKIVLINIARCFPERSCAEVRGLAKAYFIEQATLRIKGVDRNL